jgi:NTE family protein
MKVFEKEISQSLYGKFCFSFINGSCKNWRQYLCRWSYDGKLSFRISKKKGIDIVIGVDLNQGLNKRDKINSIVDILNQVIDFGIVKETKNQLKYTDVNIKPNLDGLGVTSFDEKKKLKSGYTEAIKYVEIFEQLPKKNYDILGFP